MTLRYAVILKTHFWDHFAQRQLERLKHRTGHGDVLVAVDETNEPVSGIGHPEHLIVRMTETSVREIDLGHSGPHNMFWYSNDYTLHVLSRRHPDYDYYLMLEYDVYVDQDFDVIVERLHTLEADFAGHPISYPLHQWAWRTSCENIYDDRDLHHWLLCFMALSNKGAHTLFERRLAMTRRLRDGDLPNWPLGEAAVPTELYLAGLKLVTLNQLGSAANYDWAPPYSEEVVASLSSTFVHPVLDAKRFGAGVLKWLVNAGDFFSAGSPLGGRYGPAALRHALPVLHDRLWQSRDFEHARLCLMMLHEQTDTAYRRLHGLDPDNLALGRPAFQSSLSPYSVCDTEASAAVAGVVNGGAKFHTAHEHRPWWMVDLGTVQDIDEILVFNRLQHRGRANGLEIFLSADGRQWDMVGRHEASDPFGGVDGNPLTVTGRHQARFCRLEVPSTTFLHLDQVQIRRPAAA